MKSAVIKTGGKQYLVSEGDTIKVEKLAADAAQAVDFTEVLLTATDKTITVGQPLVAGARVAATVLRQAKRPKVTGVKMKPKKRYRRYFGHRQSFTEVEITSIKTR